MPSRPRVQHVSIPRPPGSHAQTRAFYTDLLGLQEVQPPASIQHLDLMWYRLGDTEIHLFAEDPAIDHRGSHVCIESDQLQTLRERLTQAGCDVIDAVPIPGRPRFFCRDPFGNSIELTTIEEGFSAS